MRLRPATSMRSLLFGSVSRSTPHHGRALGISRDKRNNVADALLQKLANLKVDLRWSSGNDLEELLIDRIALTWLQLTYLDVMCAQRGASLSAFTVEQLERRQDRAQKRFLAAIRAAAVVRRLLAPVEVSVTARQII